MAVGGLPDAINAFLATNNMNAVSKAYKSILKEYRDDMIKYAPDKDKPHIRECFNSIPKQLAKENKKFQYNKVKPGGRSETYLGSLQWLEHAGIICRCYNTDITGLPMEGNAKTAQAKSSKTVLAHPEKYHVKHIIKFGDYNVGREGQTATLP